MNATVQYQRAFAAHLRDPVNNPAPQAVNTQRMEVYVNLLFNNINDVLSNSFPVLHHLLSSAEWYKLTRQFYAEHACQTPYFREISAEFIQWLTPRFNRLELASTYPFLLELAHYEWVEVPLLLDATVIDWSQIIQDGDLLHTPLVLNPVMLLQSYQYPVHTITSAHIPREPKPTHLILLRNQAGTVDFIELNASTARLIVLLQANPIAHTALVQLAHEMQHPNPAQLLVFGEQILRQLQTQQVILGTSAHR